MKMVLKEELGSTKMSKTDIVASYLSKITQICDMLAVVEEIVEVLKLVRIALNGLTKLWAPFVKGIVAREKLPYWEKLWDHFIQ